jgi:uncharacterized phage-associated protein
MPFSAKAVANEFLELAKAEGRQLTPMGVIKLTYLAHGWYLALAGEPLLDENVEAWRFGPVVPSLYHEFKEFGNGPITRSARINPIWNRPATLTGDGSGYAKKVIKRVWEVYKHLTAVQLSNLTHEPNSPWTQTPNKEIHGTDISNHVIRQYFANLAVPNEQQA